MSYIKETQNIGSCDEKERAAIYVCVRVYTFIHTQFMNWKPLTSDPVEIQLSMIGFFFRSQGLQCQLEFLSMKGMLDSKLLK